MISPARHATAPARPTIVAAGAHACVPHHNPGRSVMRDGELLLIDAGCELDSYASDITRTCPASGRFSPPRKRIDQGVPACPRRWRTATQGCVDKSRRMPQAGRINFIRSDA